jgi:hypothetical protein
MITIWVLEILAVAIALFLCDNLKLAALIGLTVLFTGIIYLYEIIYAYLRVWERLIPHR